MMMVDRMMIDWTFDTYRTRTKNAGTLKFLQYLWIVWFVLSCIKKAFISVTEFRI